MSKKKKTEPKLYQKDRVSITYVKSANAWCKTVFNGTQQVQTWSKDEPKA